MVLGGDTLSGNGGFEVVGWNSIGVREDVDAADVRMSICTIEIRDGGSAEERTQTRARHELSVVTVSVRSTAQLSYIMRCASHRVGAADIGLSSMRVVESVLKAC